MLHMHLLCVNKNFLVTYTAEGHDTCSKNWYHNLVTENIHEWVMQSGTVTRFRRQQKMFYFGTNWYHKQFLKRVIRDVTKMQNIRIRRM